MRVSDSISFPENLDINSNKVGAAKASKAEGEAGGTGFGQDETDLSANLQKVQELKAQLGNMPDVRLEKVQALQKAVSNGTYQVDSGKIADAMIADLAGQ